jgi:hypothetical protein
MHNRLDWTKFALHCIAAHNKDCVWYGFLGALLHFFCEALPNAFLENGFTREAQEERIRFFYYGGETKKVAHLTF